MLVGFVGYLQLLFFTGKLSYLCDVQIVDYMMCIFITNMYIQCEYMNLKLYIYLKDIIISN